ncbi:hypothetical protein N8T08_011197 [Aspergillus melleus]|uniref:Uncharacterized protein n=1 Tax=Aspergillus melleus TaxID=138277 RepID=A0ACC3ARB2_9EURO|nr:hypothetical protein N8T08_011197 [Aspergillus melleus]
MPPKAAARRGRGAAATATAASRRNEGTEGASASPASGPAGETGTRSSATPGAARAPVQRLQTLKKRAPSGSIAPAAKPPAGPDGEPAKPTLKYKPRAVGRRSKEEREAIEKLEAERHRERLAEAAAIQRGRAQDGSRGRGGAGRGRGGAMGSAGPLGSGTGMGGARRGRGGFGRFGNQDSRHSSMSRRSRSVMDLGSGHASRDVSSDESDNEVRVSIDQINLESDEDEPAQTEDKKKGKMAVKNADRHSGEKGLRPIRVERHEHEERVVSVNMESSSSKSAELRQQAQAQATQDEALFVQDDDQETTQESKEGEPRVKQEPTDDDQAMEDVAAHDDTIITDDGLLPVQKVKVRRNLGSRETSTAVETPPPKDPKSLLRTKEDIEEFDRHAHDLDMMKDLLSREEKEEKEPAKEKEPDTEQPEKPAEGEPDTAADDKKDAEDKEEDESDQGKLAGQLFLMQFPPMTPNLVVPGESDENAEGSADNAQQAGADGTTTNGGVRFQEPTVKHEDGVEVLDGADETTAREPSKVVTATDWQLPAGRVGKLNVHASGRVSMNWGGISFELDRATAVDFLQEALIVSTPPNAEEVDAEDDKRVWAMGQLSGKFTVTPDWSKML